MRHLAQKKFSATIDQQAKVIASETPGMHILKARNLATTACIANLKSTNSEEWAALERQAAEIRSAPNIDYAEQTPDSLQRQVTLK